MPWTEIGTSDGLRLPADSLRMGDGPVTEWVARLEKPEQAYR